MALAVTCFGPPRVRHASATPPQLAQGEVTEAGNAEPNITGGVGPKHARLTRFGWGPANAVDGVDSFSLISIDKLALSAGRVQRVQRQSPPAFKSHQ